MDRANSYLKWLFVLLVFVAANEKVAEAIEIHDIRWGFNDRPTAYHINPVTLLIENPDSEPFEGEIQFHQESFRGQQIDIALSTRTYVAPFEKKWVQYYPYFSDFNGNWVVSWDQNDIRHSQSFLAPRPVTEKSIIQLVTPGSLNSVTSGVKSFPEDLYPSVTGATDALQEIILDHLPKWEKTRREAFMDWIYSGGILHLFFDSNGDPLSFPDSYRLLNQQTSPAFYGKGVIYFHQHKLTDLSPAELRQVINTDKHYSVTPTREIENQVTGTDVAYPSKYENIFYKNTDEELLTTLTEISKPQQIWYLIFLLSFIYLIIVGPVYYLITKYSEHYRTFYLVYGLSTLLFCFIFLFVGRYSTNQTSQIHSLIVADILPNHKTIISEWSSLGIVSGGNFQITHTGESHIYSTCQTYSKVNGISTSGKNGHLQVDIPPNSFRTFFHRARISKSLLDVNLVSFLANETGLEALSLDLGKEFPRSVEQVHFVFGSKIYELQIERNQLIYSGKSRRLYPLLTENPLFDTSYIRTNRLLPFVRPTDKKQEFTLEQFFPILVRTSLKVPPDSINQNINWPDHRGKLLVIAKIPESLFPETPNIFKKEGLILYSFDIPLSEHGG
ncbi:hypothetical protein [Gimesia maris]|uniref:hypothetical protein n=1 Tax=Gimesia maris TaxID=122 RepID=UPI0012BA0265|nr:hypothetical protein [Gimesia maris]